MPEQLSESVREQYRYELLTWPETNEAAAMRTVVEMLAVQAKAAIDTSLQRKSRLPIRKRHGLRGQAWTHSLPMMRTT